MDNTVYTMTFTFDNDKNHLKVLNVKDEPEGSSSAKVIKKSSWPEFTDGNPLYSFEGAEFTFYKSRSDAEQETNAFTTVTTDENGVALVSDIELGTFYVKETKARRTKIGRMNLRISISITTAARNTPIPLRKNLYPDTRSKWTASI